MTFSCCYVTSQNIITILIIKSLAARSGQPCFFSSCSLTSFHARIKGVKNSLSLFSSISLSINMSRCYKIYTYRDFSTLLFLYAQYAILVKHMCQTQDEQALITATYPRPCCNHTQLVLEELGDSSNNAKHEKKAVNQQPTNHSCNYSFICSLNL